MNITRYLFDRVCQLRDQHFADQTPQAAANKVLIEAGELRVNPTDINEAADVLITLNSWLAANDLYWDELVMAAHAKMHVNEQRTWVRQADGTYQHG